MSGSPPHAEATVLIRQGSLDELEATAATLSSIADVVERLMRESGEGTTVESHGGDADGEPSRILSISDGSLLINWTNGRRFDGIFSPDDLSPTLQIRNGGEPETRVRLPMGSVPSRMAMDPLSLSSMMRDLSDMCLRAMRSRTEKADAVIGRTAAAHMRDRLDDPFNRFQLTMPTPWGEARIASETSMRPHCDGSVRNPPFEGWDEFRKSLPTMLNVVGARDDEADMTTVSMSPVFFRLKKEGSVVDAMRLIGAWKYEPCRSPRNGTARGPETASVGK